ncbi:hypothetical protein B0A55_10021 [Friedmanniomyces simplex]|uniref:Uncharacterized protein n=1 Tax=Friedmanniomyces simplex TaxID=329884 RepID=A0A4U0WUV9_9PEZI|nr:hypothetical protein B0A55_10021 [Friedmanniomyces simplex]
MDATHPAVVLEDYAETLKGIICTPDTVRIRFQDRFDMMSAEAAWGTDGFLVIASNPGCAETGHHQPYNVSLAIYDLDSLTATLWAQAVHMKDCTHRVHVEVGHHVSKGNNVFLFHHGLSECYWIPDPSETIDFSYINQSLIPPDFANFFPSYSGLEDVHLSCANCTAVGQVELVAGGFSVNLEKYVEVKDFLEKGYLEFSVNGLAAYMAFELSFLPGFTLHEFNAGLPPISILSLSIAGLFNIGPQFRPTAPISVVLDSPVDLFFGLQLSVPDNSSVILNFSDITSSSSTGFDQASISMLPFNYSAQNLSLTLSAGFKPALVLSTGVDVADIDVSGGVGVYLDLPMLSAQINHLANMTADCTAQAPGSEAPLYGSLINIVPSYDLGGGVLWELDVELPGGLKYGLGGQPELFNDTKVLPTACLAFDKQGTLVNATAGAKSAAAHRVDAGKMWFGGFLASLVATISAKDRRAKGGRPNLCTKSSLDYEKVVKQPARRISTTCAKDRFILVLHLTKLTAAESKGQAGKAGAKDTRGATGRRFISCTEPRRESAQYDSDGQYFAALRDHVLDSLDVTSVADQRTTLYSDVLSISAQWREDDYSLSDLQEHLSFLWWHFCTIGMSTSSVLDHQRLLHFLGTVKQLGYLDPNGNTARSETERQQGRLWIDLPFFNSTLVDMLHASFGGYRERVPYQGLQEWRNLNVLAARLSVSQICDLRSCAVLALRDVLEEQNTTITVEMLEVVAMWLATQGYWLEELAAYSLVTRRVFDGQHSEGFVHLSKSVSIAPGSVARDAGVAGGDVGLARWLFWRSRLQGLVTEGTAVSELAASALGRMAEI